MPEGAVRDVSSPHGGTLSALRVIHPLPTLTVTAAAAAVAVLAEGGLPDPWLLARLAGVMFLTQASIGALNDFCDRRADAVSKPWKPIPAGAVRPRSALAVALAAAAGAVALGATLGPLPWLLGLAGLAAGLAYDLRLKRTALSGLPYLVGLPLVPLWVWAALDRFSPVLWWLLPLGFLLGAGLHLANVLPDLEGDAAAGVRHAAHRLGAAWTERLAVTAFLLVQGLAALSLLLLDGDLLLYLPGAAVSLALLPAGVLLYRSGGEGALRAGFGAWMASALAVSLGWLAAAT